MTENTIEPTTHKLIDLGNGKFFRADHLAIAGAIVDADGHALDSGNTLLQLMPSAETALPEAMIIEACLA